MIRLHPGGVLLALLYMAAVVLLSSTPGHSIARWLPYGWLANAGHVPLFAGLTLVTLWALEGTPAGTRVILAGAACLVFAASDEWHQGFVPGRDSALADVWRDALGIGLATAGWMIWATRRARLKGEVR